MQTKIILAAVFLVTIAGLVGYGIYDSKQPGKLDQFAQCINDSGTIFYGAFWCPHCQAQKQLFGKSVEFLPYFECSTPDGQSQLQVCTDAGVEGYPTWVFPDGSRIGGEASLQTLAEKTGCQLPADY